MNQKEEEPTGCRCHREANSGPLLHPIALLILLCGALPAAGISYRQDFSNFVFEAGTRLTSFGQQGEWNFSASGNSDTRLDYKGDWGSGTAAGFRGNDLVMGYQHTTTTGELRVSLHLPNTTGGWIGFIDIAYTGRVMRHTMGRTPAWRVKVNGQEVPALSYSTAEGQDLKKSAGVQVSIQPGEILVIEWLCDNGPGSGYSRQIGISEVEVSAAAPTQAAAPLFNPPPGAFEDPVQVQITAPTPGSRIYYTLNAETPSSGDSFYDGTPITLEETTTLMAVALHDELEASPVTTGIYTIASQALIITGVEDPDPITVGQGTPFEDLELPPQVLTHLLDKPSCMLPVDWLNEDFDGETPAVYTLRGNLQLPDSIINPDNLQTQIRVTVQEKELTFNVTFELLLPAGMGFDPQQDHVFITGSMFDWAVPGTLPDLQRMDHQGDLLFAKTLELPPGEYHYRYYFNAGISHPEPGPERNIVVQESAKVSDVWGSTSAGDAETLLLAAYPNPAATFIIFEAPVAMQAIMICNIHGQKVAEVCSPGRRAVVSTSGMPNGLYLATIFGGHSFLLKTIRISICR